MMIRMHVAHQQPLSRPRASPGFTLVEILVSGLILSIMVALAFMSVGMLMNEWEHGRLGDVGDIQAYRTRELVRASVEGLWEYYVTDPANERIGRYYPYFHGNDQGFAFVTSSAVFEAGSAAAARLRFEPGGKDGQTGRLIYEEASLRGMLLRYAGQEVTPTRSMALLDRVQEVTVRYYGIQELRWNDAEENFDEIRGWAAAHSGQDRPWLPERIEVRTTPDGDGDPLVLDFAVRSVNTAKAGWFADDF